MINLSMWNKNKLNPLTISLWINNQKNTALFVTPIKLDSFVIEAGPFSKNKNKAEPN